MLLTAPADVASLFQGSVWQCNREKARSMEEVRGEKEDVRGRGEIWDMRVFFCVFCKGTGCSFLLGSNRFFLVLSNMS